MTVLPRRFIRSMGCEKARCLVVKRLFYVQYVLVILNLRLVTDLALYNKRIQGQKSSCSLIERIFVSCVDGFILPLETRNVLHSTKHVNNIKQLIQNHNAFRFACQLIDQL